jgi:hypothetical protein
MQFTSVSVLKKRDDHGTLTTCPGLEAQLCPANGSDGHFLLPKPAGLTGEILLELPRAQCVPFFLDLSFEPRSLDYDSDDGQTLVTHLARVDDL